MQFLEKSCKKHESWFDENTWKYPKVEFKHITKYLTEFRIGQKSLKVENRTQFDISPFWPLLTFPEREN